MENQITDLEERTMDYIPTKAKRTELSVMSDRTLAEVQAAVFMAKQFPRSTVDARERILDACKRPGLAKEAMYAYPRGSQTVTGPSIRLAEVLAQSWGNLDFGIVELEQKKGESVMMAYCVDLETNVRQTKIFSVKHSRWTKKKGLSALDDPRDIYEMTANQGARRLRACILGVIPGDIVEDALNQCEKTLSGASEKPLKTRVQDMVTAFESQGVTKEMIEKRVGHRVEAIIEHELVQLRAIYQSLKDNYASIDQYFEVESSKKGQAGDLNQKLQSVESPQPQQSAPIKNPGDYEIRYGRLFGKTLSQCSNDDLVTFGEEIKADYKKLGRPMDVKATELIERIEQYLKLKISEEAKNE